MKSQINTLEKIKKNSEDINLSYYFPCLIDKKFALFTKNQLNVAINRGIKREDLLPRQNWLFKFFSKIL
ncbi:hypothetical protein K9L16_04310 [Candidatus Pacearchaeota archaeon]|nr:hypothetical protein [Candidatus Pacearchaeota archaeon]